MQDLFSGPLFFQFFTFVMCMVLEIHSVEKGFSDFGFETFVCFEVVLLQIGVCYAICFVADNLTSKAENIADIIYNVGWFCFSAKEQKMIVAIIRQSQKPFMLDGYDWFYCSLETFGTVKNLLFYLKSFLKNNSGFLINR